jgi:hypothetical protein
MPLGGLRQAAPRPAPMALEKAVPLGERVADYEFVVRRRPSPRRDFADIMSSDAAPKSLEMDNVARAAAPAAPRIESIAQIIFYEVEPGHIEFFRKDLATETIIESESKTAAAREKEAAGFDRRLLVKVTILPAAPESVAPSR